MNIPIELANVVKCAARSATRYAINCVSLSREPDGSCHVRVTDGRRAIDATWADDDVKGSSKPFQVLIPFKLWELIFFGVLAPQKVSLDESTLTESVAVFDRGDCTIHGEPITGRFPSFDGIIPTYPESATVIGLDAAYCRDIIDVLAPIGKAIIRVGDPAKPVSMTAKGLDVAIVAAMMPVNLNQVE